MRIAVAHEWLTNWAGSEQVAQQLAVVADADQVITAIADPEFARELFGPVPVRALWPDRLPSARTSWTRYAPALLAAWPVTKIEADLLLVSSHFAAHGATVRFDGPSVVYYHTPARLLWRPDLELERLPVRARGIAERMLPALRRYDRWVAQHPTVMLANSRAVAERIKDAYGRDAQVLHPPVDTNTWERVSGSKERRHLLWFGRLVAYKQPELALRAAVMVGLPIVVIGDGPERARLEALDLPGVTFVGHTDELTVRAALADAIALIHPGEEDFGMTAVEAQAAGVPVIALNRGGARDSVLSDRTGILVDDLEAEAFADAIGRAASMAWDVSILRAHAATFGVDAFRGRLSQLLTEAFGSDWIKGAQVRV